MVKAPSDLFESIEETITKENKISFFSNNIFKFSAAAILIISFAFFSFNSGVSSEEILNVETYLNEVFEFVEIESDTSLSTEEEKLLDIFEYEEIDLALIFE